METKKRYSAYYLHYMEIKQKNPNSIIVGRLGDFYEVMGDDAKTLAEMFGLTLTGRRIATDGERAYMTAFPYYLADTYFAKIMATHDLIII